jgi:hypothetical protein
MKSKLTALALSAAVAVTAAVFAGPVAAGGNGVVASATGSGQATVGGALRTFSFTAREYADGSVQGEAQINNRSQDVSLHLALDCLVVSGNTAYMSGAVTKSSNPADVGPGWDFAVQDNGEGSNAPPDKITLVYPFGTAFPCSNAAAQASLNSVLFPIDSGNIQVH